MHFTERSPLENGFAQVFDANIKPQLEEFEFERLAMLAKARRTTMIIIAAAIALVGATYLITGTEYITAAIMMAVLFTPFVIFGMKSAAGGRWTSKIKDVAMPMICDHVGDLTYNAGGSSFSLAAMKNMNLLPKYDDSTLRSLMRGTHNSVGYDMVHATLSKENHNNDNGPSSTTVFQGLLFRIQMPNRAPGRIALMRDRGGMGNKLAETFSFGSTRSMPKVSFDHIAFEAAFEVYSDQPDAARTFLPDSTLDALLQIGEEQGQGRGAQAFVGGFEGNAFYMVLKRDGDFMKMGDINTSVAEIEDDLHGVFDDIALSHNVIDRLTGA